MIRRRWHLVGAACGLGLSLLACSALLNHDSAQCVTNSDCEQFADHPMCSAGVCVSSGLGPEGCFFGTPSTQEQFANQCSTATCETFDNCERLGQCAGDAGLPPSITPPDAPPTPPSDAGAVDAPPPPELPPCVEDSNTIVVAGSTAVQPFLNVVAPLLGGTKIAYQPSGSCAGVDNMFNPDTSHRTLKDIKNKTNLLFKQDGSSTQCSFGTGAVIDVAVSDVFSSTCNSTFLPTETVADYNGPIQPMTFVVPSTSGETSISAEMAHSVFGRGNTDADVAPYTDPSLYFVRNASSGTQQMLAQAISVDAHHWWGVDRGGSGPVRDKLEVVAPDQVDHAIGILSTDFADPERGRLRVLAFRAQGQTCAYYPDSTEFTRDKRNVRDGHYAIWGPVHFYTAVSGGVPSANAGLLVNRFTSPKLDQELLDAITKSGLVPPCAMTVGRTVEMGPLSTIDPPAQCGCYFEANVEGGSAPASCQACTGPADCPSDHPACNSGFCEKR